MKSPSNLTVKVHDKKRIETENVSKLIRTWGRWPLRRIVRALLFYTSSPVRFWPPKRALQVNPDVTFGYKRKQGMTRATGNMSTVRSNGCCVKCLSCSRRAGVRRYFWLAKFL